MIHHKPERKTLRVNSSYEMLIFKKKIIHTEFSFSILSFHLEVIIDLFLSRVVLLLRFVLQ